MFIESSTEPASCLSYIRLFTVSARYLVNTVCGGVEEWISFIYISTNLMNLYKYDKGVCYIYEQRYFIYLSTLHIRPSEFIRHLLKEVPGFDFIREKDTDQLRFSDRASFPSSLTYLWIQIMWSKCVCIAFNNSLNSFKKYLNMTQVTGNAFLLRSADSGKI